MTDRLMIAYGLMVLIAVALGAIIWWSVHHSYRRTYQRRMLRERKRIAAEQARPEPAVAGSDPA